MRRHLTAVITMVAIATVFISPPSMAGLVEGEQYLLNGRWYRIGYGTNPLVLKQDIADNYSTNFPDHLEEFLDAIGEFELSYEDPGDIARASAGLAASINEILQAQLLLGNDLLMSILTGEFRACTSGTCSTSTAESDFPAPPPYQTDITDLDLVIENLELGLMYGLEALKRDPDIFHYEGSINSNPVYAECLILGADATEDPCAPGPVPIKNEFAQMTATLEKLLYARMEKGRRLFRTMGRGDEDQIEETLADVKQEAESVNEIGYLSSAILAAAQPTQDAYKQNGGDKIMPLVAQAVSINDLVEGGFTPFGSSDLFIPNEPIQSLYTRAREAVADALASEIDARNLQMDYDRTEVAMEGEIAVIKIDYAEKIRRLSGYQAADYNNLETDVDVRNLTRDFNAELERFFGKGNFCPEDSSQSECAEIWGIVEGSFADLNVSSTTQSCYPPWSNDPANMDYVEFDADASCGLCQESNLYTFFNCDSTPYVDGVDQTNWKTEDFYEDWGDLPQPNNLGEIGDQIYNVYQAYLDVQRTRKELENANERIQIEWNRRLQTLGKEIYDQVDIQRWEAGMVASYLIPEVQLGTEISAGTDTSAKVSVNLSWDPGGMLREGFAARIADIERYQQIFKDRVDSDAELENMNLEIRTKAIELRQAQNFYNQEVSKTENMIEDLDGLIREMKALEANSGQTLWTDPSYRLLLSNVHMRAKAELDYAIKMVYQVGKSLEYTWAEGYRNPVVGPALCDGVLPNSLWGDFTELDDVFAVRSAFSADDFLEALIAWDAKLREDCGGVSMRGPNHNGPFTRIISVRRELLGYEYLGANPLFSEEESLVAFRDFVTKNLRFNPSNKRRPKLEFEFPIHLADNKYFSLNSWNIKIDARNPFGSNYSMGVAVALYANDGFQTRYDPVVRTQLQHGGRAMIRTYWADPVNGSDDFEFYTIQDASRPERSIFTATMLSAVNDDYGLHGPAEFWSDQLAGRSVATSRWKLVIDTSELENEGLDFSKLEDIVLFVTYSEGNPPCIFNCQ